MPTFWAIKEPEPGQKWQALFQRLWPPYKRWYLQDGNLDRPSFLTCRKAIREHMPEFAGMFDRLCELAGGGDLASRFLSLYRPPAYLSACSQAVWPGDEPMLVRNYDYSQAAFDGVVLQTRWLGRQVMGTSDCLIGLVDGINEDGLCVSLTFGGRKDVGDGFGVPIILRYILETCATTPEAMAALARIPSHMAYNVTSLDAQGRRQTAYLAPDQEAVITHNAVATNHQERVRWGQHARTTATVERERFLLQRLTLHNEPAETFIAAFLKPPLYSLAFSRGFGTLYTAVYRPRVQSLRYCWPGAHWDHKLGAFREGSLHIEYPAPV